MNEPATHELPAVYDVRPVGLTREEHPEDPALICLHGYDGSIVSVLTTRAELRRLARCLGRAIKEGRL